MKRQHARLAISIATLTFAITAFGYAVVAQKQAADAGATARVARAAAEAPRKPVSVKVDWSGLEARIERAERDAMEARVCVDFMWLQTRRLVTNWPRKVPLAEPPQFCPMPFASGDGALGLGKIGEAQEWPVRR